jgi:DNA-directed RNA polymerase specialized sigma24 family protein
MLKSGFALFHHQRQLAARLAGRMGLGEAEDLASEAVARSLARPAPDGRAEPWLETILRLTHIHI